MKDKRFENGITLVALVITIIVLLILAVITINSLQDTNIVKYAQNSTDRYEEEKAKEKEALEGYMDYIYSTTTRRWIDNRDGTFTRDETTVAIGEYINYTYDDADAYNLQGDYTGHTEDLNCAQVKNLKWRVMGINDKGQLELISESPTSVRVFLGGAVGYNNGVYLLNDICKAQYSNSELGITARSINYEDIEKRYTKEAANEKYEDNKNVGVVYGDTIKYEVGNNKYPTLYSYEEKSGVNGTIREGGIKGSDPSYKNANELLVPSTAEATADGDLLITQTYNYMENVPSSYFDNENFHEMIYGTESYYWIATRVVSFSNDNEKSRARFHLLHVGLNSLFGACYYYSDGEDSRIDKSGLRPIVTLGDEIIVTTNKNENSATNMWTLSKETNETK